MLFEHMAELNYYQDFLMNLGVKELAEKNRINPSSLVMTYNERNIEKVKARHNAFGKRHKYRNGNEALIGISNWVKLDEQCKVNVRNYLPFQYDTSTCTRFELKAMTKHNPIYVQNALVNNASY